MSRRCRNCLKRDGTHAMSCRHYVGPLVHRFVSCHWGSWRMLNYCSCGQSYEEGECPDAALTERVSPLS